ncbi:MAG: single-stranded DNA-binding protein, partial [Cyanobacteria bacterium P01_H01_bin.153]
MALQNNAQSVDSAQFEPSSEKATQSTQSAVYDDLQVLLAMLPADIAAQIKQHQQADQLIEVVLDLGRRPEARFLSGS